MNSPSQDSFPPLADGIAIRNMTSQDVERVRLLHASLLPLPYPATFLRQFLFHPTRLALVAHTTDNPANIIGFVTASINTLSNDPPRSASACSPEVQVQSLGVLPDFQRKGIARRLVHQVIAGLARTKKAPVEDTDVRVHLSAANDRALKFYQSVGLSSDDTPVKNYWRGSPWGSSDMIKVAGKVH